MKLICQDTPYLSERQPYFAPSGMSTCPRGEQRLGFRLRVAHDEDRGGGREGEIVLPGAVDAHGVLHAQRELRVHHRALLAEFAGAIALDADNRGVLEQRDMEIHRVLGLAFEHEEEEDEELLGYGLPPFSLVPVDAPVSRRSEDL
jgi:hypothetical protein